VAAATALMDDKLLMTVGHVLVCLFEVHGCSPVY